MLQCIKAQVGGGNKEEAHSGGVCISIRGEGVRKQIPRT